MNVLRLRYISNFKESTVNFVYLVSISKLKTANCGNFSGRKSFAQSSTMIMFQAASLPSSYF
jgi:hypothetical protein